ncbi:hypothetical protein ACWCOP_14590 [Maricaulaceae bacterium MS644]
MKHGLPFLAGLVLSGAAVSPALCQTPAASEPGLSLSPSYSQTEEPVRSAAAPDGGFLSAFEFDQEFDADLLWAAGDVHAPRDGPYTDMRYRLEAEAVGAQGLRWGARLTLGAVSPDGGRGVGGPVACAAACPDQGLVTGLYAEPGFDAAQARAGLHRAELFVRHPFVEVRAGVTETAAGLERPARLRAFRLAGADGALADPSGRGLTDTGLSLTQPAPGISLQSRRLAGLRAAVSYTPDTDVCGLDHCRPGAAAGEIGEIWSAGLSFDRRVRSSGVRWAAYAGAEAGALEGPAGGVGAGVGPQADSPWTAGLTVLREADSLTLSARWLASNDGLSGGGYEAVSILAALEAGDWLYSLEAGLGKSDAFSVSSTSVVAGASRFIGRNALVGAGVQLTHHTPAAGPETTGAALLVETGLRF